MKCSSILTFTVLAVCQAVQAQGFNLEDQKALMEAQIEMLKKQTDLNAALKAWAQAGAQSLPRVVSVGIRGQEAFTKLLFSNASEVIFKAGEPIKRGLSVAKIEESGVWVDLESSSGVKKRIRLDYAQMPVNENWMAGEVLGTELHAMTLSDLARVQSSSVLMPMGLPTSTPVHVQVSSNLQGNSNLQTRQNPHLNAQTSVPTNHPPSFRPSIPSNAVGDEPSGASPALEPHWMSRRTR